MKASKINTTERLSIISITRKFLNGSMNFLVQKKIKSLPIFFCIASIIIIII
ncbi:Uncharacterised protein [uncultured archaeon]|nr:Uncharacterised protein [uncultured archaeon]